MDLSTERVTVGGLRNADLTLLSVIAQDLLLYPLGRLSCQTLTDLFSVSELGEALPVDLRRELGSWSVRMTAEVGDLPDGEPLQSFLEELEAQGAAAIPESLRAAVRLRCQRPELSNASGALLESLQTAWSDATPELACPGAVSVTVTRTATKEPKKRTPRTGQAAKQRALRTPRSPEPPRAASADTVEGWLHRYFFERLATYPDGGLKEPMLVHGAMKQSPHEGLTRVQVLAELRRLKESGKLVHSAGRWRLKQRW